MYQQNTNERKAGVSVNPRHSRPQSRVNDEVWRSLHIYKRVNSSRRIDLERVCTRQQRFPRGRGQNWEKRTKIRVGDVSAPVLEAEGWETVSQRGHRLTGIASQLDWMDWRAFHPRQRILPKRTQNSPQNRSHPGSQNNPSQTWKNQNRAESVIWCHGVKLEWVTLGN